MRLRSSWGMFFLYTVIPLISNAIVLLILNLLIIDLVYRKEETEIFKRMILAIPMHSLITNVLPFPIIFGTLIYLYLPTYRLYQTVSNEARRKVGLMRLVNAPFNIGVGGLLGWLIGSAAVRVIYVMHGIESTPLNFMTVFGVAIVCGLINFVLSYYLIDLVNRRYYLPDFLPSGDFAQVQGIRRLSLGFRLELFVVAIATCPILILGLTLVNMQLKVDAASRPPFVQTIGLTAGLVALGSFLSFLLARSLRRPLKAMRNAALAIGKGNFGVDIPVDTYDEVGDLARSINDMAAGLAEKEKIKESFGRAVDPRVRDYLLQNDKNLAGDLLNATILFSDIRGFTQFSENHEPHEIVEWLNTYFEEMATSVREHGGIVNKYVGDAILAVFNAPLPLADHAQAAVDCALDMLARLEKLNLKFRERQSAEINIGIGIHTGKVIAGNIGSSERQEYTVIGDTVNTASRIEGLCKKFKNPLLLSADVFHQIKTNPQFGRLGKAVVKGKSEPLEIFGLLKVS